MIRKIPFILILGLFLFPCRTNASAIDTHIRQFVSNYYQLELKNYINSYNAAVELQRSIKSFLDSPTDKNLSEAKNAWVTARSYFEETKVDRSYLGPIETYSEDTQMRLERRINPWPLNDASIDYVTGDLHAGIINDPKVMFNKDILIKKSGVEEELGGLTGYPAIEFLLWGQAQYKGETVGTPALDYDSIGDLKNDFLWWGLALNKQELEKVPPLSFYDKGGRPVSDYDKGDPIKDRRRLYLRTVADLLVDDLKAVVDNLKALKINNSGLKDGLQRILFGLANCSNYELATQSIYAVLFYDGQLYTQSRPSGTGIKEFQFNIKGMLDVYDAGLDQLALDTDPDLAGKIRSQLRSENTDASALAGVKDIKMKEVIMIRLMRSLYLQGELFKQLGKYFGIDLHLEREQARSDGEGPKEAYSGGETTAFDDSDLAFQRPASNSSFIDLRSFYRGYVGFNIKWLAPHSSIKEFTGLGPIFNRISCAVCHYRGGNGTSPNNESEPMGAVIIRINVPGAGPDGDLKPDPHYGYQLRDHSVVGVPSEGRIIVRYREIKGAYPDGEIYSLRVPKYEFVDLNFGPLGDDLLFSPRVAPSIFGLGLLETVPEKTILSFVRLEKHGPDGVAGRPNYVWDVEKQRIVLGRFGWKANQPSIRQQTALALIEDIGITNPIFSKHDIPDVQDQAKAVPSSGRLNMPVRSFDHLIAYLHLLAVPARRNLNDPDVVNGERIFKKIGCAACHIDTMQTGENKEIEELSGQTIHPYTDMLLHDMGANLADGRPDFLATGREWRTQPLWGIGLVKKINKHASFLHDGRARDLEEAVLWHGGQGQASQKRFKYLSKQERQQLLLFLGSL